MLIFETWKLAWKERRWNLALDHKIATARWNLHDGVDVPDIDGKGAWEQLRDLEGERRFHRTMKALSTAKAFGVTIPADKYEYNQQDPTSEIGTGVLSDEGLLWVGRRIRKARREDLKEWITIFMPFLTLIVTGATSILGLLVALQKK